MTTDSIRIIYRCGMCRRDIEPDEDSFDHDDYVYLCEECWLALASPLERLAEAAD